MKTYSKLKSYEALLNDINKLGWKVDTSLYNKNKSDFISISFNADGITGYILLSLFNGRFFGETDTGFKISSDSSCFDDTIWFTLLLDTVYTKS